MALVTVKYATTEHMTTQNASGPSNWDGSGVCHWDGGVDTAMAVARQVVDPTYAQAVSMIGGLLWKGRVTREHCKRRHVC